MTPGPGVDDNGMPVVDLRQSPVVADLGGAVLHRAHIVDTELAEARLDGVDGRDLVLVGDDLHGASLRAADLRDVVVIGCDLRGADLRGADLRDATFSHTDLRGADLSDANLEGTRGDFFW